MRTAGIQSTNGYLILLDEVDFLDYGHMAWYAQDDEGYLYATAKLPRVNGKHKLLYMHRAITEAVGSAQYVDHRNGITLDNRRTNLRLCTNSQNQANRHVRQGASRFKGVTFYKTGSGPRPFAQIKVNGHSIYLGSFDSEEDAARAYDVAAVKHFGEFANVNFPLGAA